MARWLIFLFAIWLSILSACLFGPQPEPPTAPTGGKAARPLSDIDGAESGAPPSDAGPGGDAAPSDAGSDAAPDGGDAALSDGGSDGGSDAGSDGGP